MNIFYCALGAVLGSLYFALTDYGVLVPALICLFISTLAFTTMRNYHREIFSLLCFFLLMFLSFNVRQEYFQYFAKNKVSQQGQIFKVIKTNESAFFAEKIFLKPIAKNALEDYMSPTFIWETQNFKALKRNDLISFPGLIEIRDFHPRKINIYRKDKIFQNIKNKEFTYEGYKESKIDRLSNIIKRFYRAHLQPKNAELALGLILGSRNANIDKKTLSSVRNLGLGHFFSASGFHLVILLLIIMWLCSKISLIAKFEKPIAISFLLLYMTLLNFTPSITRAGFMAIAFILFKGSNRKIDSFKLLISLAAIVLIIDPYTAFDIGFQLSYLATLGIIVWYEAINTGLAQFIKVKWLREIVSITISTQLLLLPLVLYYFSNLQIWSILANIIFTPFLSLITVSSFTGLYFLLDPLLTVFRYILKASNHLIFIDSKVDLDLTSLILIWIMLMSFACYLLKSFEKKENLILNILRSKNIQLSLGLAAFFIILGTNLKPFYVSDLKIHNGKIQNAQYSKIFKSTKDYEYFTINHHKALLINSLPDINIIKNDIQEVNFLFIPNLTSNFIYMDKLVEFLKPNLTVIYTKSKTTKVKENLSLIGTKTNTLYGSGHLYISQDKYWKVTN